MRKCTPAESDACSYLAVMFTFDERRCTIGTIVVAADDATGIDVADDFLLGSLSAGVRNGNIYWCDCGNLSESDLDDHIGTLICASGMRWRSIENHMGENEFYHSTV